MSCDQKTAYAFSQGTHWCDQNYPTRHSNPYCKMGRDGAKQLLEANQCSQPQAYYNGQCDDKFSAVRDSDAGCRYTIDQYYHPDPSK